MKDDSARPSRRSWRNTPGPTPRPRGTEHQWKSRPRVETKPAGAKTTSRTVRVGRALVACLVGVGLIFWLIWWIRPVQPACMVLIGADYATNLRVPHNVYGVEGLKGLEALANAPRRFAFFNP